MGSRRNKEGRKVTWLFGLVTLVGFILLAGWFGCLVVWLSSIKSVKRMETAMGFGLPAVTSVAQLGRSAGQSDPNTLCSRSFQLSKCTAEQTKRNRTEHGHAACLAHYRTNGFKLLGVVMKPNWTGNWRRVLVAFGGTSSAVVGDSGVGGKVPHHGAFESPWPPALVTGAGCLPRWPPAASAAPPVLTRRRTWRRVPYVQAAGGLSEFVINIIKCSSLRVTPRKSQKNDPCRVR